MKTIVIPAALLTVALAAGADPGAQAKIVETSGTGLRVESTPRAAKVFIDGIEMGRTPLTLSSIEAGVHTLRITKERYDEWTERIGVPARRRLLVSVDLVEESGTIAVNITSVGNETPGEVRIFIDGVETGGRDFAASAGRRTVTVRAFGMEDAVRQVSVERGETVSVDVELRPAAFRLGSFRVNRSVINPAGSGAQGILAAHFTVSAAGSGRFVVLRGDGAEVYQAPLGPFTDSEQSCLWDGRDSSGEIVARGAYRVLIEASGADGTEMRSEELAVLIDPSLDELPLSLASALAGLRLVPVSDSGRTGALQLEAAVLFGKSGAEEGGEDMALFAAGFAVTPREGWQASAAINVRAGTDGKPRMAGAGSVKRELRRAEALIPGVALAASYGWVDGEAAEAAGIKSGVQICAPLSWRCGRRFSIHGSPALLWTGDNGYPAESAPRLIAAGGILARFALLSAAISAETVSALSAGVGRPLQAALAAELRFTPPRSSLSAGLLAGLIFPEGGAYGGLSIGALY